MDEVTSEHGTEGWLIAEAAPQPLQIGQPSMPSECSSVAPVLSDVSPLLPVGQASVSSQCSSLVPVLSVVLADQTGGKLKKAGKRKDWEPHGTELLGTDEETGIQLSLGAAAAKYIKKNSIEAVRQGSTTIEGRAGIIYNCGYCEKCTKKYCFTLSGPPEKKTLTVETCGACGGPPNAKRLKKTNAKEFAKGNTPGRAFVAMQKAGLPKELWPSENQLKEQRRCEKTSAYQADCVGALEEFVREPPPEISIFKDHVVCTAKRVLIPFTVVGCLEKAAELQLPCFLEDFTFQTNQKGLLLGAIGPCGLHDREPHLPTMGLLPVIFILADSEDQEAMELGMRLYLEWAEGAGVQVTDGVFDCKIFTASQAIKDRPIYVHRCLQHVKSDVRVEAKRKDEVTGRTRLQNAELLPEIEGLIEFAAFLPKDVEQSAFFRSILTRMQSSTAKTDWNEPEFAKYLGKHILDTKCSDGLIHATFASGLGAIPLGITTFAPNTMERSHRTVKGLLPKGYKHSKVTELVTEIGHVITARLKQGKYDSLKKELGKPMSDLYEWPKTQWISKGCSGDAAEGGGEVRDRRLGFNAILSHYQKHGAGSTFIKHPTSIKLSTGHTARWVYVMPKYQLKFATERAGDMERALNLALAQTEDDVRRAASNKHTGTYDIFTHRYLRQTFVSVFFTADGYVLDEHKHFQEAGVRAREE